MVTPGTIVAASGSIGERFVIPQVSLLELIRLEGDSGKRQIERIHGTPVYRRRGQPSAPRLPERGVGCGERFLPTCEYCGVAGRRSPVRAGGGWHRRHPGDRGQTARKAIERPELYAGATIMGDGQVAFILDVLGIGQRSVRCGSRASNPGPKRQTSIPPATGRRFCCSGPARLSEWRFRCRWSRAWRSSPVQDRARQRQAVVQYRGGSCHWLLWPPFWSRARRYGRSQDPAQVVVFTDGERSIGILVDQILDIVGRDRGVPARSRTQGVARLGRDRQESDRPPRPARRHCRLPTTTGLAAAPRGSRKRHRDDRRSRSLSRAAWCATPWRWPAIVWWRRPTRRRPCGTRAPQDRRVCVAWICPRAAAMIFSKRCRIPGMAHIPTLALIDNAEQAQGPERTRGSLPITR